MKLKTNSELQLTDFVNGKLYLPETGKVMPATNLSCGIASFFRKQASWTDYPNAQSAEAKTARDALIERGFLCVAPYSDQPSTSFEQLEQPAQTMFDVPYRRITDISKGEIVFVGAPFDMGTTGFPGARFGPHALRMGSVERYRAVLDLESGGLIAWNIPSLGGAVLGGARLSDLGDVTYRPGEPVEDYYARLKTVLTSIYEVGAFPVVLGGDHSITYATVPSNLDLLVHIDAHCDLAERVAGHCHHHGNFLTRLLDEKRVNDVCQFGLRDTSGWDTQNAGTIAKSVGDLELENWSEGLLNRGSFISLDLDVLDPSVLPGTGTPIIGGLSLRRLCQVLARVATLTRPTGIDVVELCPMRDASGLSERTAIEAILCFLAVYHKQHISCENQANGNEAGIAN